MISNYRSELSGCSYDSVGSWEEEETLTFGHDIHGDMSNQYNVMLSCLERGRVSFVPLYEIGNDRWRKR